LPTCGSGNDGVEIIVTDPDDGADCSSGGGTAAPHPCWCDGGAATWKSLPALGLSNFQLWSVDSSGNATYPGMVAGKAPIVVDGNNGGTRSGGIVLESAASDFQLRTQDGTGRVSLCWNTDCDSTPVTLVGSEDSVKAQLTTAPPAFVVFGFDGSAAAAGATITWTEMLKVTNSTITYKGVTIAEPAARARCEVTNGTFPAAAFTAVAFTGGCAENTNTMFSAGTNTRVTIKTAGHYIVAAEGQFSASTSLPVWGRIRINGSTVAARCSGYIVAGSAIDGTVCTATALRTFAVNDYVEALFQQHTTGSTTVSGTFRLSVTQIQP
jgi:hypothetical protein